MKPKCNWRKTTDMTSDGRDGFSQAAATLPAVAVAVAVALVVSLGVAVSASAAPPPPPLEPEAGGVLGLPARTDPEYPLRPVRYSFPAGIKAAWLEALEQGEVELRRQAIEALAGVHEMGLPELEDVPPRLVELLESDPSLIVRRAAAEALVRFDYQKAASELLAASEAAAVGDHELTTIVDSALAQWGHEPARAVWRQRLEDGTGLLAVRRSAARSLGEVGAGEDATLLARVAASREAPVSLRVDAAEALGRTVETGLLDTARSLAEGSSLDRMLAASMLYSHADDQATALLVRLVRQDDRGVAAKALRGLAHTRPRIVFEMRHELLDRDEPNLRHGLAEALAAVPEVESVRTLEVLLDDPSRAVRWRAREVLIAHGERSDLREEAWAAIDRALADAGPYGQEQAALAAGKLDHKAAASVLVDLLHAEAWRVRRAAANAMHELEVSETLPAIHARLEELVQQVSAQPSLLRRLSVEHEMVGLMMALGVMRYAEADALLRRYVPKDSPFPPQMRAYAIWALGHVHKDTPEESLVDALVERLTDTESENPEAEVVRLYSAMALGLMRAEAVLPTLEDSGGGGGSYELRMVCRWAVERITGEPQPAIGAPRRRPQWFIEPMSD